MGLPSTITQVGTGNTPWVLSNSGHVSPANASFQVSFTGVVSWSVVFTLDDPNAVASPVTATPVAALTTQTGAAFQSTTFPFTAFQLQNTGAGTVVLRFLEAGVTQG